MDYKKMLGELIFITTCGWVLYNTFDFSTHENKICDYKELNSNIGEGVLCSKNVRLSVKQSNEHVLMIAPSGVGKSRKFIGHNLRGLSNCSIVVNNPNGELRNMSGINHKKYVFNPFDDISIGYNPLVNCRTEFDVEKLATILLESGMSNSKSSKGNQQEWVDMSKPLLTSYFLYVWYTKKYDFYTTIKNIMTKQLVPTINEKGKIVNTETSIAEEILESNVESAIIKFRSFMKGFEAKGTIASIYSVMNTCLRVFVDNSVKSILTKKNFDINILRNEDAILFIEIPERHTEYFKPLTNLLINQLMDRLFESKGKQIYFLLDEFGNMKLENLTTVLSTARKQNISIVGAVQSLNQLRDIYGEQTDTIRELFKTILVCSGLRDSTEYISKIVGQCYVKQNKNGNKQLENLMNPDEIRRIKKTDMLIICDNKRVVRDEMMDLIID